jgi:hypothetical protein
MTIMKNDNAPERAVVLVQEMVDVLLRTGNAPESPLTACLPARARRELRRGAARLRQQKVEPRYKNLHSAEELADLYERTAQRDEIVEKARRDLQRISLELKRIRSEKDPDVEKAMVTLVKEAARSAEEHGPRSEAAQRFRCMQLLEWVGQQAIDHRRKPGAKFPWRVFPAGDPSVEARYVLTAAEGLDSSPPGETVIAIPEEGKGSARGRALIRIGVGEASWIGSFETGSMSDSTVLMMPDCKHLFVSAQGAGYIIDLRSRSLVETVGTEVVEVIGFPMGLFVVNHNVSLEAFGRNGRLWKTGRISCGGFRGIVVTETRLIGEARQPPRGEWCGFSLDMATGEVRFAQAAAVPKSVE